MATFTWNARRELTVKNSRQKQRAHRKRTESRRKVKNGKGERIGDELDPWKGVDSNARCDKTRQNCFFFPNEKERKLCKKKRRRGERDERGGGGGGKCLTFFKGIINSLSALVNLFLNMHVI